MRVELEHLRQALGATLAALSNEASERARASGVEITGASIDSRKVRPGHLFACLPGARADGHDFAQAAVQAGAAAILAQRPVDVAVPVLLCDDVTAALGRLAAWRRDQTLAKVVGVTGSAGKTTLKEILAHSFAAVGMQVSKTAGNFNNQLGLPLSILAADESDDVWVLELGVSRPGDMDELAAILRPDVAVIHNVGPAHLEALGDVAGVAREKAKLLDAVSSGGVGVVCADYPELRREMDARPAVGFATFRAAIGAAIGAAGPGSEYFGDYVGQDPEGPPGTGLYRLRSPQRPEGVIVKAPFVGAHFLENLLAALATLELFGHSAPALSMGLSRMAEQTAPGAINASGPVAPGGRFNCLELRGATVIDDSYNANPLSMRRSIQAALEIAASGEKVRPLVLALGSMGELGESAAREHRELGRFVARLARSGAEAGSPKIAAVFARGDFSGELLAGLAEGGFSGRAVETPAAPDFLVELNALKLEAPVALIKGSRSAAMDEFSTALARTLESGCGEES